MAMFKRVLESLSKSLGGNKSASAKTAQAPAKPAPSQAPASSGKQGTLLDKVGGAKSAEAKKAPASPEEMCGITPKMSKEQISARLKLLYRRFNRGASSLDQKVRTEADQMLDAIVAVREKTFGEL